VPKTKVDESKVVEIARHQKKSWERKIKGNVLLEKEKILILIENSQAGRHGFDPRRPLQNIPQVL
jgi:hypothetical protein